MPRHRTHSLEFKRQVAHDYVAGETLHSLAKRHDLSRNLIRIWVQKYETGAFDEDAIAGLKRKHCTPAAPDAPSGTTQTLGADPHVTRAAGTLAGGDAKA